MPGYHEYRLSAVQSVQPVKPDMGKERVIRDGRLNNTHHPAV